MNFNGLEHIVTDDDYGKLMVFMDSTAEDISTVIKDGTFFTGVLVSNAGEMVVTNGEVTQVIEYSHITFH